MEKNYLGFGNQEPIKTSSDKNLKVKFGQLAQKVTNKPKGMFPGRIKIIKILKAWSNARLKKHTQLKESLRENKAKPSLKKKVEEINKQEEKEQQKFPTGQ